MTNQKEKPANQTVRQKMSLFSCVLMGIGSIIGASIFATTPIAIKIVGGNGIVLGFLFASIFVFVRSIPEILLCSSLPVNGASYMYLTRLVHPYVGALDAFNELMVGSLKVATMALTFATYFSMMVPACPPAVAGIACTVVFTIISTFGVRMASQVQNVCVFILLAALGVYIFFGWGATTVSFQEVITTTFELTKMWAAMGILHGSLIGANVLVYAAEDIENPGRNVPIAFLISTIVTAILYGFISYITVAVMPNFYEIDNLATVAGKFLSPGMLMFFISGGALLAVVTSINSAMMMFSRINFAAARDGFFPSSICKTNKHGAPHISLWVNSGIAIAFIASGFNLNDVVKITTIPGLLLIPIIFLGVFMLPKKYPNAYKNSYIQTPHALNCTITVIAALVCFLLGGSVLSQMEPKNWITMLVFYVGAFIYAVLRFRYMKSKGIDIFEKMRAPYEPWNALEEKARLELAAKGKSIT